MSAAFHGNGTDMVQSMLIGTDDDGTLAMHNRAGQETRHSMFAPKESIDILPSNAATDLHVAGPSRSRVMSTGKAKSGPGGGRKKASRACATCQKAHLTCDDARPCMRCVKRGMADTCTEGHRKRAKYLLDDEELASLPPGKSKRHTPETAQDLAVPPLTLNSEETYPETNNLFNANFGRPFEFEFGSENANLEYAMLSAILGNSNENGTNTPTATSFDPSSSTWPAVDVPFNSTFGPEYSSTTNDPQQSFIPPSFGSNTPFSQSTTPDLRSQLYSASAYLTDMTGFSPQLPLPQMPQYIQAAKSQRIRDLSADSNITTAQSPSSADFNSGHGVHMSQINEMITKPYDYTEGYHFLMKHLPSRFEKNDILRIVRALAIYRPSLIAMQMPLTVEDEVFVEKCFQRSLSELGKLISFSGTPTVIWRRTGEICLVAPEFCLLAGWSRESLQGKYVYELFENQSVVEYWESFATHAFENTTQSIYSHCVLLKPNGQPVPCTFCFSIRRDIYDLPSLVIGQWLPLL